MDFVGVCVYCVSANRYYKQFEYVANDGKAYAVNSVGDSYHGVRKESRNAHIVPSRVSERNSHWSCLSAGVSRGMPWNAYDIIDDM